MIWHKCLSFEKILAALRVEISANALGRKLSQERRHEHFKGGRGAPTIIWVILDDTQRIYPQVRYFQIFAQKHSISNGLRQSFNADALKM
jgi:hypothetical protein